LVEVVCAKRSVHSGPRARVAAVSCLKSPALVAFTCLRRLQPPSDPIAWIEQHKGSVIFIDEAYAPPKSRDCILLPFTRARYDLKPASEKNGRDVVNHLMKVVLTNKEDYVFILAGYKDDISKELYR
jgi:hypothetical protein